MRDMNLKLAPVLVRCLLDPLCLSGPTASTSWTHSYSNIPNRKYNLFNCPPCSPLICSACDITVAVKIVTHNPMLLTSQQKQLYKILAKRLL